MGTTFQQVTRRRAGNQHPGRLADDHFGTPDANVIPSARNSRGSDGQSRPGEGDHRREHSTSGVKRLTQRKKSYEMEKKKSGEKRLSCSEEKKQNRIKRRLRYRTTPRKKGRKKEKRIVMRTVKARGNKGMQDAIDREMKRNITQETATTNPVLSSIGDRERREETKQEKGEAREK